MINNNSNEDNSFYKNDNLFEKYGYNYCNNHFYFNSHLIYHTYKYIYLYINTFNIIHKPINYIIAYH